jgi:hypothetical protein
VGVNTVCELPDAGVRPIGHELPSSSTRPNPMWMYSGKPAGTTTVMEPGSPSSLSEQVMWSWMIAKTRASEVLVR